MLLQRKVEPLFEVGPFQGNVLDFEHLKKLLSTFPPCDVVQRRSGAWDMIGRDDLLTFRDKSEDSNGLTYSEGVRALEAQLSNMIAHISDDELVKTEQLAYHRDVTCCPFFGACDLQRRVDDPLRCADAPWEHYEVAPTLTCWYSSGVAGTLGTVEIKGVKRAQ